MTWSVQGVKDYVDFQGVVTGDFDHTRGHPSSKGLLTGWKRG